MSAIENLLTPSSILKNRFGYDSYRPLQCEVIENVMARRDTLAVMLHKEDTESNLAKTMFDLEHKPVVFVPKIGRESSFTDPSYHLVSRDSIASLDGGNLRIFCRVAETYSSSMRGGRFFIAHSRVYYPFLKNG